MVAAPRKQTGYAEVNGISMYYEIHGEGAMPLLLLHGGGSSIDTSFGSLIPLLAPYRRLVAMDLQAHGRSGDREAPVSFEQDADDVAALMKHLRIDKADVLGFSNGATATLQMAIRHPELVRRIVPIAAVYRRDGLIPGFFEGMAQATLGHMPAALQEAYRAVAVDKNGLINMFNKDRNRMIHFQDIPDEQMAAIQAPALLMANDRDVLVPAHLLRMAQVLKRARMVMMPGTHGALIGSAESDPADRVYDSLSATVALLKAFLEAPDDKL